MGLGKSVVKGLLRRSGYELVPYRRRSLGEDPFSDIAALNDKPTPVVFDVGANKGQTVASFKQRLPLCIVHSFEPSSIAYAALVQNTAHFRGVHLNKIALGRTPGRTTFFENVCDDLGSLLEPDPSCGKVADQVTVDVSTVDEYCVARGIAGVDVLKVDAQGFDLEVLKGAGELMAQNRIRMVFTECIFWEMYKGMPAWTETSTFLVQNRFKLVSFYRFKYRNNAANWSNALFINPMAVTR